ncbi:MAG: CotH kinase family protein [Bacteroidetes bacterium]|nr:CotH kinase family protein [Bacteroidota bacterium]
MKHIYYLILLNILFLAYTSAFSQVYINEACPRNGNLICDEDGDFEDWIELYNASPGAVELQTFHLSDRADSLNKWTFPDITVASGEYLTVFASGKDRINIIDHWETVVYAEDTWKYLKPQAPVDPAWTQVGFDDADWESGQGGFGYGDGDDNTYIAPPFASIFIRKTFTVTDTSVIASAVFNMDYDDGFIAYINGVEIVRSNVGVTGTPSAYDEPAYEEHEALMYRGERPEEWKFTEEQVKSVLVNGTNVLAIQVHNVDLGSSDLTAIPYLSAGIRDNSNDYGTPPAWFKMGASWLHTSFKLSGDGETVYFSDQGMNIIDTLAFGLLHIDHSFGRLPDGTGAEVIFGKPTPDSTNNSSSGYSAYTDDPSFSVDAGFFPGTQYISLSSTEPGAKIRYTLDGSEPADDAALYTSPLTVDSSCAIRARAFNIDRLPSNVITNSYFIDDPTTLPIVSITTHPDNFWDWEHGIYVMGPNAEPDVPYFNANFWQDWEVPVHIEFFDVSGSREFEQDFGAKIHGGWSRSNDLKSLRILAKGKYGKSTLDYRLFPDKDIDSFKRFVLRNSGNETNVTHFRDALMHKAVHKNTHIDIQDYRPAVVYLNGKFFAVLNLREKISEDYLAENHGVDPDSVDLLQFDGYVIRGSNEHFLQMAEFIVFNDMELQDNYENVKTMLDIENFCDYFIAETYYVNWDWPQNNVKYWRENKPGARWRYIMTDVDFGLGLWGSSFSSDDLDRVIHADNNYHSFIFRSLLNNTEFRHYFINRYADLINTIFLPQAFGSLAYAFRDSIAAEMPRQFDRWGGDMETWNWNIDYVLADFINSRPEYARKHIQSQFELNKQVVLTLNVYPEGAGSIKINTITPEEFPWTGIYFDGVPVEITALPNPGYEFSFWQSLHLVQTPDHEQTIEINIDTDEVFTAYFFGAPDTVRITISEINYNSLPGMDGGDWIELYNFGTPEADISGWTFSDSNDDNVFVFPQGTTLSPGERLVVCRDTEAFHTAYPSVANFIGPFDFGLSSAGDSVRIFDADGNLKAPAVYSSQAPWPAAANGQGPTLELLDPYGSLSSPANWFAGCSGGSPGTAFEPCNMATGELPVSENILFVYPNPATDRLNIAYRCSAGETVRIRLTDQFGRTVAEKAETATAGGRHSGTLSLEGFSPGIYYCSLISSSGIRSRIVQVVR